jgi:hypothetical protein
MASIDVTVDIDIEDYLNEASDRDLIEELEGRGYEVIEEAKNPLKELSKEELDHLRDMVINGKPGSIEWSIYQKIRKV